MRAFAVVMVVGLTACASSSQTYGPDGEVAYNLNCSGLARTWGACLEKAGDICQQKGYKILSSSGETAALIAASISGNNGSMVGGTGISRSMVIACKP